MKNSSSASAFSLVELIVAVAITGILLLGVSVFFTQHLGQLNHLESQSHAERDHFIFQEILRKKLMQAQSAMSLSENSVILENKTESENPFSIIGLQDGKVVLKDFFKFQGVDSGKTSADFSQVPLASGMTYLNGHYYVASFSGNVIYSCDANANCNALEGDIQYPLGMSNDGNDLFVTQPKTGKVLRVDKVSVEIQIPVGEGFNIPTGVAYYQDGGGKEYLFVADAGDNVVKRIDLKENKTQIIAGGSNDPACNSSAVFCGLNFPTALTVEGEALYIADSGNGRILKVSEPETVVGVPSDLSLAFEIDPEIALESFLITGNFEGGSFDEEKSNLVGSNYDVENKKFSNLIFETAGVDLCKLSKNLFTQQALDGIGFKVGDAIGISGDLYNILGFNPQKNCQSDPQGVPILRYETNLNPKPAGKEDQFGYGANHKRDLGNVILALTGVDFNQSGFQTVSVETKDFELNDVVETDKVLLRIGDGSLGSEEDKIEVWVSGLNYPNGVSVQGNELWVTDGKENTLTQFNLETKALVKQSNLPTLDLAHFSPFDLSSPFQVQNFQLTQAEPNLLEISFDADVDENKEVEKLENYTVSKALKIQ